MSDIKTISQSGNRIPILDCMVVRTYPKSTDDTVTLANIEHRFENAYPDDDTVITRTTRVIVDARPMSHEHAMDLATCYAKDNDIPVIIVMQDKDGLRLTDSIFLDADTVALGEEYRVWVTEHWTKRNTGTDDNDIARPNPEGLPVPVLSN